MRGTDKRLMKNSKLSTMFFLRFLDHANGSLAYYLLVYSTNPGLHCESEAAIFIALNVAAAVVII